ncbi:MAG: hypothetical protein Q4E06_08465 [Lautropia sp.]|nr:hypothetical protein [Lautropia sp.]
MKVSCGSVNTEEGAAATVCTAPVQYRQPAPAPDIINIRTIEAILPMGKPA